MAFRYGEFQRLLRPQCRKLCELGLLAGWDHQRIATRIQEVGDYLGLPSAPTDRREKP